MATTIRKDGREVMLVCTGTTVSLSVGSLCGDEKLVHGDIDKQSALSYGFYQLFKQERQTTFCGSVVRMGRFRLKTHIRDFSTSVNVLANCGQNMGWSMRFANHETGL